MLPAPSSAFKRPQSPVSPTTTDTMPDEHEEEWESVHGEQPRHKKGFLGFGSRSRDEASDVDEVCDYEQKYAPDEEHKEMSPNARVWKVYLDECRKFDTRRFEEWRDGLDVLVVFSGLFSIVVAIFCSQAFQRLRPDHHSMTSALLAEMVEIERAIADGTPVEEIAHTITDFTPKTSDLWVNGLCFSSLGVSIFIAVVAMLAKQWLRQYMAIPSGDARDCVRIRHFRYKALEKWRVPEIIAFLPVLMHVSLGLFLAGLVIFLFMFDDTMAIAFATMMSALFVGYTFSTLLPLFYPECPYKTTLSLYSFGTFSAFRRFIFKKGRPFQAVKLPEEDDDDSSTYSSTRTLTDTERAKIDGKGEQIDIQALSWLRDTTSDEAVQNNAARMVNALRDEIVAKAQPEAGSSNLVDL
ncbi:hypothetical protein BDZ89DRAFT_42082 [Hymenopellis radicata]|nr:hypothetical protein BDZ89DRAFT_42082 [Hymenopellis radicata]